MGKNKVIKFGEVSIFKRISTCFKNIFQGNEKSKEFYNIESTINEKSIEKDFISEMKEKNIIINLQEQYENNYIKEEELTEKERESLIRLYKEQINTIENDLQMLKRNL